jgi:hypothetical protein
MIGKMGKPYWLLKRCSSKSARSADAETYKVSTLSGTRD